MPRAGHSRAGRQGGRSALAALLADLEGNNQHRIIKVRSVKRGKKINLELALAATERDAAPKPTAGGSPPRGELGPLRSDPAGARCSLPPPGGDGTPRPGLGAPGGPDSDPQVWVCAPAEAPRSPRPRLRSCPALEEQTRHPPGRESCSHPSARGPTDPPLSPGSVPHPPPLLLPPERRLRRAPDPAQLYVSSRPGLGPQPELAWAVCRPAPRRPASLSPGPQVPGPAGPLPGPPTAPARLPGWRPGRCNRPGGGVGYGAQPRPPRAPRPAPLGRLRPLAVASRRPRRLRPRPPLFLGFLPASAALPPRSPGLPTAETAGPTWPHSDQTPSPSPAEANPAQDPGQRPQAASAGAGRCGHVPARWALAPLCRPLYLSRVWL
ncbi:uncharacterized protein [Vulpes vulpes]|uniref:Basic proline-rich protein-like n=1 Tax=Vulpes vulpes TaxID=9627 RepID=A0ABM5AVJ2_VULVU